MTGRVKAENGVLPPLTYNLALSRTVLSRGDFMPLTAPILPVSPPLARPLIVFFCARVWTSAFVQVMLEQGAALSCPRAYRSEDPLMLFRATPLKMLLAET